MDEVKGTSRTGSLIHKDWTRGPILKNLLLLSWPMVVMEALYAVSQIWDLIWIGRLGSSAIAGAGIANIILMLILMMDVALTTGMRAVVSRYVGEGDWRNAGRAAGQAYRLSAAWGVIVFVAGILLAGKVMQLFGVDAEVAGYGMSYLKIMTAGWISMDILVMGLYILQSTGDTLNPLKIEIAIRVVHLTLCPFLVLGLWVFPHLGITGAAVSNIISQVLGAALGLWLLFNGRTRLHVEWPDFKFIPNVTWKILKIGIPAMVMYLQSSLGSFVLTWIVIPFGTIAVAAHSLAIRMESFILTPSYGLGAGAGVLTGQNLGAQQPQRAQKGAWLAVGVTEAFLILCAAAILVKAESIIRLFNNDPALIGLGATFLRIACAGYLVSCVTYILQSCMAGAGDTLPNMIIGIVMIWVVQLPLAFLLSRVGGLGVLGVRWAMVGGWIIAVAVTFAYFRLGRWKRKKI
jgi:putative MATE family efflux protein